MSLNVDDGVRYPAVDGRLVSGRRARQRLATERLGGRNAGNPPYVPTVTAHRRIGRNELELLDLWGKLDRSGAVFADITWMGFTGRRVPERYERAFAAVCAARDAAATGLLQAEILALG